MTLAMPPVMFPPEPDPTTRTGRVWLALAVVLALLAGLLAPFSGCGS